MILNERVMHFLQSKNSTYLWSFVGTPCLLFLGCNYFLVIDNYEVDLILIFLHLIPVTPSWWFKKKNFVWLKGSRSPTHWCYLFFITGFSDNFKGNQQTRPQEREENYFADTENSPYMLSEDDSTSLSDPDNWSETPNGWWF